jgi:GTP cyclohydrolase I
MAIDPARVEAAVGELLAAIGEDPSRPGLVGTPARVAEAYGEFFAGVGEDPLEPLADAADSLADSAADGADALGELVVLRDVAFRSICEHHLLPFLGTAHLAYAPGTRIVGLGRLPRVVEILAARPQLQERLTEQIADALDAGLAPEGVLVVLDAVHGCVTARGPRQTSTSTITVASRGTLSDPVRRTEVMALIGGSTLGGAPA